MGSTLGRAQSVSRFWFGGKGGKTFSLSKEFKGNTRAPGNQATLAVDEVTLLNEAIEVKWPGNLGWFLCSCDLGQVTRTTD